MGQDGSEQGASPSDREPDGPGQGAADGYQYGGERHHGGGGRGDEDHPRWQEKGRLARRREGRRPRLGVAPPRGRADRREGREQRRQENTRRRPTPDSVPER